MSTAVSYVYDANRPGKVLTLEQKRSYQENGFIVVRNVVPVSEIERYRQRFQELCEAEHPPKSMTIMRDISIAKGEFKHGERAITKVQDFGADEVLFSYCKYRPVVDIVGDIIGHNSLVAMHTMLINKPPDTGTLTSRHPMHQDLQYFPFRPAESVCCAWTAMEKINRANGCLVVVPGSHKGELLPHDYPEWEGGVNKAYHGIVGYDPEKMSRLHVEMEAGDTVFFHPILIHGSGVNRSKGFRKAISCHYANGDKCQYMDVKGTTQEFTSNEVIQMAKKKFASYGMTDVDVDFADIWRFRARAVNGSRGNL